MILDCNEIIPARLWVGGFIHPEEAKLLARMSITTVVNLQSDDDLAVYGISLQKLLKAYMEGEIQLRRVPTQDFNKGALSANLPLCVTEVEKALEPSGARVYLHCTAGINRAPTTAAAYLMRSKKMSPEEACAYLTARRHCSPYLDVLEEYADSLKIGS